MTQPGAPAPDGAPPQPHVPPPWPAQAGPIPPQPQGQPRPPRTDSTRMMAIIALVISGFTLLGLALSTIAPLLFFGVVALGLGAGFGDVIDDGELASSSASYSGGEVTPAADGSVAGSTLATAVVDLVVDGGLAGRVTCDPVARVGDEVSVLCRATDPTWYGIVRFSGSDGSFDVLTMGGADGPMMP